jgi:hypothetical protein
MSSLADTYNGSPVGALWSRRQLAVGVSLFITGVLMCVGGIIAASTRLPLELFDMKIWQAWEAAGLLGGIGIPLVFVGVFIVLPATPRLRAAAGVGLLVAFVGVALFYANFPFQWYGDDVNNAPIVLAVYATGVAMTFWCLFTAVVNFKTRNNPGGTVSLRMVIQGRERVVEVSRKEVERGVVGGSGVGFLGNPDTDYVETQTAVQSEEAMQQGKQPPARSQQPAGQQVNNSFDADGSPSMRDAEVYSDD